MVDMEWRATTPLSRYTAELPQLPPPWAQVEVEVDVEGEVEVVEGPTLLSSRARLARLSSMDTPALLVLPAWRQVGVGRSTGVVEVQV